MHGDVVVFTVKPWWRMFVVIVTGRACESANPAAGPGRDGLSLAGREASRRSGVR